MFKKMKKKREEIYKNKTVSDKYIMSMINRVTFHNYIKKIKFKSRKIKW